MKIIILISIVLSCLNSWAINDTIVFCDRPSKGSDTIYYHVSSADYLKEVKSAFSLDFYNQIDSVIAQRLTSNEASPLYFNFYVNLKYYNFRESVLFDNILYKLFSSNKATMISRNNAYRIENVKVKKSKAYSCCGAFRSGTNWSVYEGDRLITNWGRTRNKNAYVFCNCGTPDF